LSGYKKWNNFDLSGHKNYYSKFQKTDRQIIPFPGRKWNYFDLFIQQDNYSHKIKVVRNGPGHQGIKWQLWQETGNNIMLAYLATKITTAFLTLPCSKT
jgi:hypothetical protein